MPNKWLALAVLVAMWLSGFMMGYNTRLIKDRAARGGDAVAVGNTYLCRDTGEHSSECIIQGVGGSSAR